LNSNLPSTMERLILREINVALGNALRYCGRFQAARKLLEDTLTEPSADEMHTAGYIDLLCGLGDMYCELDDSTPAQTLLEERLQRNESSESRMSIKTTRLYLSLAETYMRQDAIDYAERIFQNIQHCRISDSRLSDFPQLRLRVGLARIAHMRRDWPAALSHWTRCLRIVEGFQFGVGHTTRVIHYSISDVLSELGEGEFSSKSLSESEKMSKAGGCIYWITGLSLYWFDRVRSSRSKL